MPKRKLTFDQLVYIVVAAPTIFFATYIVSAVLSVFVFGYLNNRFRIEQMDRQFGIFPVLGSGEADIIATSVLLLIPTFLMTRKFFNAGWPNGPAVKGPEDKPK